MKTIVNIKRMIINESRMFNVFDDNVLNLDIIYIYKLYHVNLFNPDTLINTNRVLWTNARIFKGWSSGDTLGKVWSLLPLDSNCPFCPSLNPCQHSRVSNRVSPGLPIVFRYGILGWIPPQLLTLSYS